MNDFTRTLKNETDLENWNHRKLNLKIKKFPETLKITSQMLPQFDRLLHLTSYFQKNLVIPQLQTSRLCETTNNSSQI
jgi:hypothetical protein